MLVSFEISIKQVVCGRLTLCVCGFQDASPIQAAPIRPRPGLVARGEVELEIVELTVPTPSRRTTLPSPPLLLEVVIFLEIFTQ
jgi:hypothetical protein